VTPARLIGAHLPEPLRRVHEAQRTVLAEPPGSVGGLLPEGVALRPAADLRRIEACERLWSVPRDETEDG